MIAEARIMVVIVLSVMIVVVVVDGWGGDVVIGVIWVLVLILPVKAILDVNVDAWWQL